MVAIYEQISRNKRNSYILLSLIFIFVLLTAYFFGIITGMGEFGTLFALFFAIIYSLIGYFFSDSIALAISGAREAKKEEYPYLYNTVEGVSIAAGIPMPKVYVIDDPAPNAFATGRDPKHSAIAVTTGLLQMMNRAELEGVIGHEIAHIKNYDVRFATLAAIMVGMIAIMGDLAMRVLWAGGGRGERKGGAGILLLIGLVFIILAPIFGHLVRLALSRKREFLADADGALLTRNPEGLANALEKLKNVSMSVRNANEATAPLYFVNPLKGKLIGLFSTHPPIEERIKALKEMAYMK
jgi:heat shock protein HtpX